MSLERLKSEIQKELNRRKEMKGEDAPHGLEGRFERMREFDEQQVEERRRQRELQRQERIGEIEPSRGRVGIADPEQRANVQRQMEELGPGSRLVVEAAPATIGTALGGAIGAGVGGPPGLMAGAGIGGTLGELLSQETGITPESNLNIGLSGGAPVVGPMLGGAAKGVRRTAGLGVRNNPVGRAALGHLKRREGAERFHSAAADILSQRRGIMQRSADDIFDAARRHGIGVPADDLANTRVSIIELGAELERYKEVPEVDQALKMIDRYGNMLDQVGSPVTFDDIIEIRSSLGRMVNRAERSLEAGGSPHKFRAAGKLFRSLDEDLDKIMNSAKQARRPARLVREGFERAKLEKSALELERAAHNHMKLIEGQDAAELDVQGFRQWFNDVTNPRHPDYRKNFTDALDQDIPEMKEYLRELDELARAGGPGGPGSIVVRGITAGSGAAAGQVIGGPLGATFGAVAGAQGPEVMAAVLTHKGARDALLKAAELGKGAVPAGRWANITQVINQSTLGAMSRLEERAAQERERQNGQ